MALVADTALNHHSLTHLSAMVYRLIVVLDNGVWCLMCFVCGVVCCMKLRVVCMVCVCGVVCACVIVCVWCVVCSVCGVYSMCVV